MPLTSLLSTPKDLPPLSLSMSPQTLLSTPLLNKGLGFTKEEREDFGLETLLPPAILTLDEQISHAYAAIMRAPDMLARHVALRHLQDQNETLFYALIERHLSEFMPLIYTPGVGEACLHFSKIWQQPRGLFLTPHNASKEALLKQISSPHYDHIRMIIMTDGERILGLGDLGANGMGIPIGKVSLYTVCAGLNPAYILPVTLDIGTNNEALLQDPSYIGLRQKRLRGQEYDDFIENIISIFKERWSGILLHWEDFAGHHAAKLLQKYRHTLLSFNDDIQGTAAITAASLLAAVKAKKETLSTQKIFIFGAGAAGCGIAEQLFKMMQEENIDADQATQAFYLFDRPGLLTSDMEGLSEGQKIFARHDWQKEDEERDLLSMMKRIKPTILIGVSGHAGAFTEELLSYMAQYCPTPIIFPLSNPTSHIEAVPENILDWTQGRAIISTGSPFQPVLYQGKKIPIDQTNNSYIFPGLGLGALACKATEISDKMLIQAAKSIASLSPRLTGGTTLLPPLEEMKKLALTVAYEVALQARNEALCPDFTEETLRAEIKKLLWHPLYRPYRGS